jgi:hypothetical protein
MRFANVDGNRTEALPKMRGSCPACEAEVISKCGKHVIWHWAHKGRKNCDRWWESETDWHRSWKNNFPADWQEIIHTDPTTSEKHIADVKTPGGLVLEFQHSPINPNEVSAREDFYRNLIWIVDGLRNELDKNFFSLSISKPIEAGSLNFPIRWWGQSRLLANWAASRAAVYLDFGENLLWKIANFDAKTKSGIVMPNDREKLIRSWAEA